MASRFKASRLLQQLTSESNVEDTKKLRLELVLKNKEIRSFENGSTIRFSSDFGSKLHVYLSDNDFHDPNRFVGSIKKVFVSKFQADSVIGKRAPDKKSSIIFGNDTDFAIFLGQDYLAVSDFEFQQSKKGGLALLTGSKK